MRRDLPTIKRMIPYFAFLRKIRLATMKQTTDEISKLRSEAFAYIHGR